jgi:hypothetical protein
MCQHRPICPSATDFGREAAHVLATHPQQGWSLLCNGVLVFEDTGELLPDGHVIAPRRPTDPQPLSEAHAAAAEVGTRAA